MSLSSAAMLVRSVGIERARELATSKHERRLVDIAHQVLADEQGAIGIGYSGLCLTGLPYRRLADDQPWEKVGHRVRLLIEPGRLRFNGQTRLFGVPWGSRGRILLIHLMTTAVRTGSPEVELGRSMHDALGRMGLCWGGEVARNIADQIDRLAACNLKFLWGDADQDGMQRGAIVSRKLSFHNRPGDEGFQGRLVLDEQFYMALREHPVPMREEAIKQLSHSPMALDCYCWLVYRLHALDRPVDVSWPALYQQFGTGYRALRQFRFEFHRALTAACAAYPEARVGFSERGVYLHPSDPPVLRLFARSVRT